MGVLTGISAFSSDDFLLLIIEDQYKMLPQ